MPNNSSLPNPIPASPFASPKLFVGFSPKALSADSKTSMSPTSTLEETKHFLRSPPTAIGLGQLVDILYNDNKTNNNKSFLFGYSQLKIQVPSVSSPAPSPLQSPIEFGINTKDSQLALHSPSLTAQRTMVISSLSRELLTDMELSEEYTCVISHGQNPKITHIFDNCVVESCGGVNGFFALKKECNGMSRDGFLSFCHSCKKNLSQGKDIFMYRGEKAFCGKECRRQEMRS